MSGAICCYAACKTALTIKKQLLSLVALMKHIVAVIGILAPLGGENLVLSICRLMYWVCVLETYISVWWPNEWAVSYRVVLFVAPLTTSGS